MRLRVGTRTSTLALTQARAVAREVVAANPKVRDFEIVGITTRGDTDHDPLQKIGGTGLFTSAVREALLGGECDIVVHSAKDLPAKDHPELALFYPPRASAADVLCAHVPFAELPEGARVGTGSPRRAAQLRAARSDIEVVAIRGNVPTRLGRIGPGPGLAGAGEEAAAAAAKLAPSERLDGVILAHAGLSRLGLDVGEELPYEVMLPAAGQGALGLEARRGSDAAAFLAALSHEPTRVAVVAERAFMAALGAGCTTPVAVLGRVIAGGATETRKDTPSEGCGTSGEVGQKLAHAGAVPTDAGVGAADAGAWAAGGSAVLELRGRYIADGLEVALAVTGRADQPEDLARELAERFMERGVGA